MLAGCVCWRMGRCLPRHALPGSSISRTCLAKGFSRRQKLGLWSRIPGDSSPIAGPVRLLRHPRMGGREGRCWTGRALATEGERTGEPGGQSPGQTVAGEWGCQGRLVRALMRGLPRCTVSVRALPPSHCVTNPRALGGPRHGRSFTSSAGPGHAASCHPPPWPGALVGFRQPRHFLSRPS